MRRSICLWLLGVAAGGAAAVVPVRAQDPAPPPDELCLACHGSADAVGSDGRSIAVDGARYAESYHGMMGFTCVTCHTDLAAAEEWPHAGPLAPVACAACHPGSVAAYDASIHAVARRETGNGVAATCVDCHSAHEILPSSDSRSLTYALNLPGTCSRCHGDAGIIERGHIAIGDVSSLYRDSIHGRAITQSGLLVSANCSSCHGSHDIRQKSDPQSRVNHLNVPRTCGSCHEGILTTYDEGAHGAGLTAGNGRSPVCIDCHSAHAITRTDLASWQLDAIGECGTCHTGQIRTYRDTFHGQVTSLGFTRVATCADCHSAHSVYPTDDSRSMVSDARRLETCQQCHANATAGFAQYDPHADRHDRERNPTLYFVGTFMEWLLISVFGFFGLHAVLWLPRGFRERRRQSEDRRASSSDSASV